MQRVRIGLTGLAFVFLAVLLAAIFTNQRSDEQPVTPNLVGQQQKGITAATPPADPLAQLGVAPGNVDSNESTQSNLASPPQKAPAQ